ncbi:serine/threonine-protein phosphatase 6 regulatory ankyrin repeat subunit B-like [Phymastichus coffea]|uniref:serine/threonine-protein phosphatase 6 regulatory ankyrin repeat subunit B-like n=1 Tax=Phymastichus coffea TaxID=108790 RepID=UPI00273CE47D|nr:serine/threonine-protein phosphatase 6 regulatory ankyrin repeat subunit B-like [Phymastichus coffea]
MLNEYLAKSFDESMNTLLHYAVLGKSDEIVQYLIELGAEVNSLGKNGNTPFKLAVDRIKKPFIELLNENDIDFSLESIREAFELKNLSTKIFEHLLRRLQTKILDTELLVDELVIVGFDIMLCAKYLRNVIVIRCMLQRGFDVNSKDCFGKSALQIACTYEEAEFVKLLIDHGADVNTLDRCGHGPLWVAACHRKKNTMIFLLEAGANPNVIDDFNLTAMAMIFSHLNSLPIAMADECLGVLFHYGTIPQRID